MKCFKIINNICHSLQHFGAIDDDTLEEKFPMPKTPIQTVIIDCSAMSYMDSVAVTTLTQVRIYFFHMLCIVTVEIYSRKLNVNWIFKKIKWNFRKDIVMNSPCNLQVIEEYKAVGVTVLLAACKGKNLFPDTSFWFIDTWHSRLHIALNIV